MAPPITRVLISVVAISLIGVGVALRLRPEPHDPALSMLLEYIGAALIAVAIGLPRSKCEERRRYNDPDSQAL